MNTAFLILGSNIGDRLEFLNKSIEMISVRIGDIINKSSVYESEPWGFDDNINFYNQVIEIKTQFRPEELLKNILQIELDLGRERNTDGYSSRTIDIDILFYNYEIINTSDLIIPHPRMHKRVFTLLPLLEIAPKYLHPLFNKSTDVLLSECADRSYVKKLS